MNYEDILKLCSLTLNQFQCRQWYAARRFRISASNNIHSIKIWTRKSIDKLVNDILYPSNVKSESTKYSLSEENNVQIEYEKLNDCEVKKIGVIISKKQPWLCASLDHVIFLYILQ